MTRQNRFSEFWEEGDLVKIAEGVIGGGDIGIVWERVKYPSGAYRDCYNILFSDGYRMIHFTNMQEVKDGSTG